MAHKLRLDIVRWEGKLHCVYLDDHRIAGGKPWGGGTVERSFNLTVDDLFRALSKEAKAELMQKLSF